MQKGPVGHKLGLWTWHLELLYCAVNRVRPSFSLELLYWAANRVRPSHSSASLVGRALMCPTVGGVQHLFEHLCISGGFGLFGYLRSFYLGMYHYLHNAAPRPPLPPYPNVPLAQLLSYKMSPVNIWKMSQSVQYLSLYLSAIR